MNLRRALLLPATAAAAMLAVAACSSTTQLDMDKLEAALKDQLPDEELKSLVGEATCPDAGDVKVEEGGTFECTLVVDGQPVRIKITQDNAKGDVSYERLDAVVDLAAARDQIASGIKEQLDVDAEIDCGTGTVKVVAPQATFECTATDGAGDSRPVTVTVNDVAGNVTWSLG